LVKARRFYCDAVLCGRRIFTERFDGDLLRPTGSEFRPKADASGEQ
jgi:hypothetical protein